MGGVGQKVSQILPNSGAVQRGNSVNVYNERGVMLFSKVGELIGYTGTTVTIRRGNQAITYSDKGIQKFCKVCS
ncbi:hypothetical protein [Parasutterella excrementihominis]|jgi:hypothetical protein|nr:hypothetical protein [Parasutterella excrementihominis]